jgi:hypothetical protein
LEHEFGVTQETLRKAVEKSGAISQLPGRSNAQHLLAQSKENGINIFRLGQVINPAQLTRPLPATSVLNRAGGVPAGRINTLMFH